MNVDLNDRKLYENRELSWLSFNRRVLEEAQNPENPLFERIKFLSIVSSNLDEFFMVRVASLKEQVNVGYEKLDFSGMNASEQLEAITAYTHEMVEDRGNLYKRAIIPGLKKVGIHFLSPRELNQDQSDYIDEYFEDFIYPVLTPMGVDASRPFPLILNKSLNVAVILKKEEEEVFATIQVPSVLPRYVTVPSENSDEKSFVLLEDIIMNNIDKIFVGYHVKCSSAYRLTRNSDLSIDEEEAQDLLIEIEKSIKKRKWGEGIRLEVQSHIDTKLLKKLKKSVDIHSKDIYYIIGAVDLTFLMKLYSLKGYDHLKFRDFDPCEPKDLLGETDLFEAIHKKDIFLSHPFEKFDAVVDLITAAAKDEKVLAIKQTLYRVSGQSPIIKALAAAAEAGKQVTVLVELKARFDEENNIQWAKSLEKSGCHVIYGLVGLKTHSKVTLIVRSEASGIRRYVHLGTGNYNDITARFYTDVGLLTCNEKMGADVSAIFNAISGYSDTPKLLKIAMAPTGLREKFVELIHREIQHVLQGKKGKIIAKMNSLCDQEMIEEFYKASIAGVEIELIVRGVCSLIPGIEGVSHNITVRSIIGKYLEHSRIYYFENDEDEEVYLSSADLMPRNLDRRVELFFPIEDENIKARVKNILEIQLVDVVKGKIKDNACRYNRIDRRGKLVINSQEYFEDEALKSEKEYVTEIERDVFRPVSAEVIEESFGFSKKDNA
ncbi:MAG: RNA degradosome polyphosphate kinase [Firmicutes bacterium HGW-Firmicutes-3]|jgi:polyphosphate kinase|nr:MAG: RNA degradosome polyphosphate kinase [Firmicutes bacterium HGW-Firmicutes-3]